MHRTRTLIIAGLASLAALAGAASTALAGDGHHGGGHTPVTICHKDSTIVVDDDAVPGHLRHGDTLGACTPVTTTEPPATTVPATEPPTTLPTDPTTTTIPPVTTTEPATTTEAPTPTTEPPAPTTTIAEPATTIPAEPTTTVPPTTAQPATFDQELTGTVICGRFRGEARNTGTRGRAVFTVYVDGNQVDSFTLLPGETRSIIHTFAEDTGVHTVQVDWAEGPSGWTVGSDCRPDTAIDTPADPNAGAARVDPASPGAAPAPVALPETR